MDSESLSTFHGLAMQNSLFNNSQQQQYQDLSAQHSPPAYNPPSSSAGPSGSTNPGGGGDGGVTASATGSNAGTGTKQIFEFTKRKRWADLLITELSEAIILVLSGSGKVLYCGNAVLELLGWRDEELVDRNFIEFMNVEDRTQFRALFTTCIHQRSELLSYTRLQCKPTTTIPSSSSLANSAHRLLLGFASGIQQPSPPSATPPQKEVLFEIKGYPHFVQETNEFKCFFAMAKPYPSRNTAMLNTFLELKMENERLQDRKARLQAMVPPSGDNNSGSPSSSANTPTTSTFPTVQPPSSSYASTSSITTYQPPNSTSPYQSASYQSSSYQPSASSNYQPHQGSASTSTYQSLTAQPELRSNSFFSGTYEELLPSPVAMRFDGYGTNGGGGNSGAAGGSVMGGGPSTSMSGIVGGLGSSMGMSGASNGGGEDEGDQPRKKLKKIYTTDQYVCVTCGRTDSPEWRKGPLGPKTLCNACGLRWAKRVRTAKEKEKDDATAAVTTTNPENGGNGGAAAS